MASASSVAVADAGPIAQAQMIVFGSNATNSDILPTQPNSWIRSTDWMVNEDYNAVLEQITITRQQLAALDSRIARLRTGRSHIAAASERAPAEHKSASTNSWSTHAPSKLPEVPADARMSGSLLDAILPSSRFEGLLCGALSHPHTLSHTAIASLAMPCMDFSDVPSIPDAKYTREFVKSQQLSAQTAAIARIRRAVRVWLAKRGIKTSRYERHIQLRKRQEVAAAIVIQRVWRGYILHKAYKASQEEAKRRQLLVLATQKQQQQEHAIERDNMVDDSLARRMLSRCLVDEQRRLETAEHATTLPDGRLDIHMTGSGIRIRFDSENNKEGANTNTAAASSSEQHLAAGLSSLQATTTHAGSFFLPTTGVRAKDGGVFSNLPAVLPSEDSDSPHSLSPVALKATYSYPDERKIVTQQPTKSAPEGDRDVWSGVSDGVFQSRVVVNKPPTPTAAAMRAATPPAMPAVLPVVDVPATSALSELDSFLQQLEEDAGLANRRLSAASINPHLAQAQRFPTGVHSAALPPNKR